MPDAIMPEFDIKADLPILATAYGEAADQNYDTKVEVLSTILNLMNSGKEEFDAHTGNIHDVLKRWYYAYSRQSPKFMEAMQQKFPDKVSESSFKEFMAIWAGMMRGDIQRTDSLFFFTPQEIKRFNQSKTPAVKMNLLEETSRNDTWRFFKYKPAPSGKKDVKPKPPSGVKGESNAKRTTGR